MAEHNEEPHVLPSKRKQAAQDADAEATKKRQVESCTDEDASAVVEEITVNQRPSGGVEIDRKGKAIMEYDIGKGTLLNVDMDKKIVIVKVGEGLLEADMDEGIVKIGIGKGSMKFNVGEGKPIEDKLTEGVESFYEESDEDDESIIRSTYPPVKAKC
ncbi:unnamed protein product [Lactuca virosa]|uniref:Uncharacterized protein n=1 Tax=Lactuca virosa TaxID=75947 RepID=A0AAU9NJ70_9ASTR|nr:unnamed protein product [Lactuca virosa]